MEDTTNAGGVISWRATEKDRCATTDRAGNEDTLFMVPVSRFRCSGKAAHGPENSTAFVVSSILGDLFDNL